MSTPRSWPWSWTRKIWKTGHGHGHGHELFEKSGHGHGHGHGVEPVSTELCSQFRTGMKIHRLVHLVDEGKQKRL